MTRPRPATRPGARPPLYLRRPLLAGFLLQWPLLSCIVVVAAAGVPGLVTADVVKPGAAVLDVGVSRVDGKIAGDIAKDVVDVAGHVAPNPGGVGPMTRAMLLANIVEAAENAS